MHSRGKSEIFCRETPPKYLTIASQLLPNNATSWAVNRMPSQFSLSNLPNELFCSICTHLQSLHRVLTFKNYQFGLQAAAFSTWIGQLRHILVTWLGSPLQKRPHMGYSTVLFPAEKIEGEERFTHTHTQSSKDVGRGGGLWGLHPPPPIREKREREGEKRREKKEKWDGGETQWMEG